MLHLPYGRITIPLEEAGMRVLTSRFETARTEQTCAMLVCGAMAHPLGSGRLYELAYGKRTCTIILSDHTRPVPSREILPAMLGELRRGNPEIEITLLVATGFHRGSTKAELEEKLGAQIVADERIVVHDSTSAAAHTAIGTLPSGVPLVIDRLAAETDLLIAEGLIEPHFFAGFSGGRKSVLPGVCDRVTVFGNHCSEFIDSPFARTGILDGNPIHRDMVAAAQMAKLAFVVNVVAGEHKQTRAAFAGNPFSVHAAGCALLKKHCEVTATPADIVITTNGGAPLDQNIYQCVKALTAAEAASREGGVLILLAECADGTGGDGFYRSMRDCVSPAALYAGIMATPQDQTRPDQWQSQILARVLMHRYVIFVTRPELAETIREMKMEYAASLQAALDRARQVRGRDADVIVIPDGVSLMVRPAEG